MPIVSCGIAAFAVASIFYSYRGYIECLKQRHRLLRERVAYMLWIAANAACE
jgi:hypothetical protein